MDSEILIVDDDILSLKMLEGLLIDRGYRVYISGSGSQALDILDQHPDIGLVIADLEMPEMDGLSLCIHLRMSQRPIPYYFIMLTASSSEETILEAFDVGVDDYIVKPFSSSMTIARVVVGLRQLSLQSQLFEKVEKLEEALENLKVMEGIIPICSVCHKIRDDKNYWERVDKFVSEHSNVKFSHSICPNCAKSVYGIDVKEEL